MNISIKHFSELTSLEVYNILDLRNKIFVVEQNCAYLDTDGNDFDALHLMIFVSNQLVGYARLLKPGVKYNTSSIGRVLVRAENRGQNLGHIIVKHAILAIENTYKTTEITISAQAHLQEFYNKHNFKT